MGEAVESLAVIRAGGKELPAAGIPGLGGIRIECAQHGEGSDDGILSIAGPVLIIYHGAAGSNRPVPPPGADGIVLFIPVEQVCADRMAPADVGAAVRGAQRIVLIEHVEDAIFIDQPVGIVEPAPLAGKVVGRTQRLPIQLRIKRVLGGGRLAAYDAVQAFSGDAFRGGSQQYQLFSPVLPDIQEKVLSSLVGEGQAGAQDQLPSRPDLQFIAFPSGNDWDVQIIMFA